MVRLIGAISVSMIMLVAGLYVILFGAYDAATKNWAFGIVGLVTGFWLPDLALQLSQVKGRQNPVEPLARKGKRG